VRGARENNLRDVSVDIPKRAITVFTGVSGSGKSSLVFGTIAAESQRLINETYTAFIQSFMPNVPRPDVDTLTNLTAAILVDQERMGANARSTVGTATDAYTMLRLIFSRLGEPYAGPSNVVSFNDPQGMCPACEGMGRVSTVDVEQMVDRAKSLNEGAITLPNFGVDSWQWRMYAESGHFDADKKLADYSHAEWEKFLRGEEERVEIRGLNLKFEGLVNRGRTLIVIEHDLDIVAAADWVIDMGPGAGHDGGTIVFEGPPHELVAAEGSLTGRHLAERLSSSRSSAATP
jgi:excinuclease UvrABC ATPase subunit